MEGANSYSSLLNPNPNPIQPPSNYCANHYGFPLFSSTMANPLNTFIYHPSPRITVFSVPADATVIIQRRIKHDHHHHHFMPTSPNVNLSFIPRVPSGALPPSTLRQASLPMSGLRSRLSGHCNYNTGAARRSKMHAHIDLNKAPCDTNFEDDDDDDDDQEIKSIIRCTYKCHVCMAEFRSPQAYGGHMSFHSKQNRATYEKGESSRPCKKAKENPNYGTAT